MHCFDVLEMQGVQLGINIARAVVIVAAFLLGKILNASAVGAVGLYAVSLAVLYGLSIIVVLGLLNREAHSMK